MANLKNLSERIKSVTSIQQVTKAMKMVAAAKVKKAQDKMEIAHERIADFEVRLNDRGAECNASQQVWE